MPALMWFRNDLRLSDNPALTWAAERGPVVALVIDEPAPSPARPLGAAATWWRERSIRALAADLERRGVPLLRRRGDARTVLPSSATRSESTPLAGRAATTSHCATSTPK